MSNELRHQGTTGKNFYAIVFHPSDGTADDGKARDVVAAAWDTIVDADWDDYNVDMTEQGTASGIYYADLPAGLTATEEHEYLVYDRAGATAAVTDAVVAIGTVSAVTLANINTEVVDTLATDTYVEPAAVPAATATLAAKINWLAALSRNKQTQTNSTTALRNDGDSGNIATSSTGDDGTTFTAGEWT